jgi:hypothetical protein
MRFLVALVLAACKFQPPASTPDGMAVDAPPPDPTTTATNLHWDTVAVPTALWDPAEIVDTQALQLYSDSACTTTLGATVPLAGSDVAFPMPIMIGGAMSFSIDTITSTGSVRSGCSSDVGPCPTNYVRIGTNTFTGGSFCLAKYELRDVGGLAEPIYPTRPWGDITKAQALAACAAAGPRYHLTTNPEWMATAREIEGSLANWSTTTTPFLKKGHTDDCVDPPVGAELASSTDDDPCFGTLGPNCTQPGSADFRYNRTFVVASGAVIWDFAGNSFEILDHGGMTNATQGDNPGTDINQTTGVAFVPSFNELDYKSTNQSQSDSANNVGVLFREQATSSNLSRGGDFCLFAGIYSVSLLTTEVHHNVGFRCVYDDL